MASRKKNVKSNMPNEISVASRLEPARHSVSRTPQAESLKYKLLGGLAVRRACYGVLRFIMESGAKGAEVRI